eukprot:COSAG04_NODE_1335_length_7178_cov_14.567679_1_plen_195_part_00
MLARAVREGEPLDGQGPPLAVAQQLRHRAVLVAQRHRLLLRPHHVHGDRGREDGAVGRGFAGRGGDLGRVGAEGRGLAGAAGAGVAVEEPGHVLHARAHLRRYVAVADAGQRQVRNARACARACLISGSWLGSDSGVMAGGPAAGLVLTDVAHGWPRRVAARPTQGEGERPAVVALEPGVREVEAARRRQRGQT